MILVKYMEKPTKFTYKLILSYKGTKYSGWQNQTTNPETVQNYVEKVVAKIAKYQKFQVIGASRTDTGVHSRGQTIKVVLPREIDPNNLLKGMNSKLPKDIKVVSCEFIHEKFNVNRDSKFKEYHYYFTMEESEDAFSSETVYSFPKKLNLELMQHACKEFVGEHNFLSFCTPGPLPQNPNRVIMNCSIEKTKFLTMDKDIYYLKIEGTGFLKYMVRFLMGALWDIGQDKLSTEDLIKSLKSGEKHGVRTKAPAQGLHLIHIKY
jgi:tRNA pseudouridine38-40 synthase